MRSEFRPVREGISSVARWSMFQQRFVRENQRQRVPSPARRSRLGDMQILLDAVADARRGRLHGITGKVSVPGGRLHLGVTEQFSNHGQTLTERQRARGEGMPDIIPMNRNRFDPSASHCFSSAWLDRASVHRSGRSPLTDMAICQWRPHTSHGSSAFCSVISSSRTVGSNALHLVLKSLGKPDSAAEFIGHMCHVSTLVSIK